MDSEPPGADGGNMAGMTGETKPFWERDEIVERFAGRDPDHRLVGILDGVGDPGATAVLDLGCAGGRNAVLLAERGYDFTALDSSAAMVAETRRRVAAILGEAEAERRVVRGTMTDLSRFADGSFDLVVALGVHHTAPSRADWERAIAETARVTKPGGRVLVAAFTNETDPDGEGLTPVAGEEYVYERKSGRCVLVPGEVLDGAMVRHGLVPAVPTEIVRRETENGVRVTANALYSKAGSRARSFQTGG